MPEQPSEVRTFEQIVDELEQTVARLANGSIGIEEATDLYERAEELHKEASDRLAKVQERIDRLAPPTPPAGDG